MQQEQWEKDWARRRDDGWGAVNQWGETEGNAYCGEHHHHHHNEEYQGDVRRRPVAVRPIGVRPVARGVARSRYQAEGPIMEMSPPKPRKSSPRRKRSPSPQRGFKQPLYYPPGSGFIPANKQ